MAKIHYFQRYASIENTVTNNTLQLIARIYEHSPNKASQFISELTGESIEIGIEINQQVRGNGSVPDGLILQRSFKILIESKVNSPVIEDQLLRHSDNFSDEEQKVLLLLTIGPISDEERIKQAIANRHPDVVFKNITYETICKTIQPLFREFEYELRALADDYEEYCNETGLFDQSKHLMRIVPCGKSFEINNKYGIYFHPIDRGYTKHSYIGIYKNKVVQCLWKLESVFDVELVDGNLQKTLIEGRSTNEFDKKIEGIIRDAKEECGYEIQSGHRFFCGTPLPTQFIKTSPGGIQGARIINLKELLGDFNDADDIAHKLKNTYWE